MGVYRRKGSRFWWMSYAVDGIQHFVSTKTTDEELALQILKQREAEIVLGLFKVGWPGERMTFEELSREFERSHFTSLSPGTVQGNRYYLKKLRGFFGERRLARRNLDTHPLGSLCFMFGLVLGFPWYSALAVPKVFRSPLHTV